MNDEVMEIMVSNIKNEKAIVIKDLRKEYGSKIAVNNISLEIEKGSLFSMLGVNGAGKTTTIKMLTGLTKPTAGEAFVMGKSIINELDAVKKIVSVSPQDTAVAPNLTVRENLEFIAGVYGFNKTTAKKKAEEMIDKFSLNEIEKSKAKTLSGGWQRRLSIAMALISEPQILFLDEPTLGLDVIARRELWRIIESIKENVTIILTTHYMEEAEKLSDRVAVMVQGTVKAVGTVKELLEKTGKENLEEAFVSIVEQM